LLKIVQNFNIFSTSEDGSRLGEPTWVALETNAYFLKIQININLIVILIILNKNVGHHLLKNHTAEKMILVI